jgi:VIT1/CCC1 family predicted Fe2+/Mn2+ transporter
MQKLNSTEEAKLTRHLLDFQRDELTESLVYHKLAQAERDPENKKILERISADEAHHSAFFKHYTGIEVKPNKLKSNFFYLLSRAFGNTFAIKRMENGELSAQFKYTRTMEYIPKMQQIIHDENNHEKALIGMIKEERLNYISSIVLGLNDALVELTGALAGFTLALGDPKLVALTGSITGISASLSMASSEYLSTRMEGDSKHALQASLYTGSAYLATVVVLILPFILLSNVFLSLSITLGLAISIIALFNYYYSVVKDEKFKHRFIEMAVLSLSVAAISFGIGYLLKLFTGIEI